MSFGIGTRNGLGLGLMSPLALTTRRSAGNAPALAEFNFVTETYYENGTPYTLATAPGWTFARSTTGYGADIAGLLTSFAIDAPRVTNQGLLVEAAATNLFLRSQTFAHASWLKIGATVTPDEGPGPTGVANAARLELAAGFTYLYQEANPASGAYVISVWAYRDAVADQPFLLFGDGTLDSAAKLATATLQRFSFSGVGSGGTSVGLAANGVDAADLLIFGAQLEVGTTPSSYIETAGSTVTRAADVASLAFTGGTLATVTYGGGLTALVPVTTSLNLGASSAGPWVGSYVESVVVR